MYIQTMTWLCLLAPLVASIVARIGVRYPQSMGYAVTFSMLISFWMSSALFYHIAFLPNPIHLTQYTWGIIGSYHFEFGFWLDAISLLMAVVVSGIATLVCIYSLGYMQGEKNFAQFFSYIAFFGFAMLWLVFSNNLLQLFFGWEGVGIASYLLIGFWSEKERAAYGSTKAFLMNRAGDVGLVVAMALILKTLGSLHYDQLLLSGDKLMIPYGGLRMLDWIGIGLLLAAMAKSAQMPLHLWLPDTMVGPTPISALIHAATMVTAGIFLITRFSAWFVLSPLLQNLCISIGLITSILTGLMALTEYNLKRIIAYSTISQLGVMMVACGLSAHLFSLFHLVTHAVFKSLLFLTAGMIILASDHQEDVRDMGGLKSNTMIHLAMITSVLSLCAIPPLGGFFSKDAILMLAKASSSHTYMFFVLSSVITTLYAIRLYYLLFIDTKPAVLKPIPNYMQSVVAVLMGLSLFSGSLMLDFLPVLANQLTLTDDLGRILDMLTHPMYFIYHALISWEMWLMIICIASVSYWEQIPMYENKWISEGYGLEKGLNKLVSIYGYMSFFLAYIVEQVIDFMCVVGSTFWASLLGKGAQQLATGKLYHYLWIMMFGIVILLVSVI